MQAKVGSLSSSGSLAFTSWWKPSFRTREGNWCWENIWQKEGVSLFIIIHLILFSMWYASIFYCNTMISFCAFEWNSNFKLQSCRCYMVLHFVPLAEDQYVHGLWGILHDNWNFCRFFFFFLHIWLMDLILICCLCSGSLFRLL